LRISLACNWKLDLLTLIENDNHLMKTINDFYGASDMSFTGSGRPFFLMAKRDKDEIESNHKSGARRFRADYRTDKKKNKTG